MGAGAGREMAAGASGALLDPGHLDGLQDAFPRALGVIVELLQRADPLMQIRETHILGIDVRMGFIQSDGNVQGIRPFQALVMLGHHVDGVLGDFHHEIGLTHHRLAA